MLRLRRHLSDNIADPVWVAGYRMRTFTPDDAPDVHRILSIGYAQGGGTVGAFDEWWPSVRDDDEFDAALCVLAIDEGDDIVGVAQCWTSAFIKDLVVHPSARGRGIAEALLKSVFQEFRRRGASHVDLKIEGDNSKALRLYGRLGMLETDV